MGSYLPDQGSNLSLWHWKAKSHELDHKGSPIGFWGLFFFFGHTTWLVESKFSTRDGTQDLGTESLEL